MATRRSATPKMGVIGASKEYLAYLRSLGLRAEDLTGKLDKILAPSYFVIICRGETDEFAGLRRYLNMGGRLLFHRYPPNAFPRLARELGLGVALRPYGGVVGRAEGHPLRSLLLRAECDVPLLEVLPREDLYWLGDHRGIAWAETPRGTGVADGVVALPIDPNRAAAFDVEAWQLAGHIVERRPPGVVFATNGSATGEVDFPETATYVLGLVASGTPCDGVYPVANVTVDGRPFGTVSVEGREVGIHTVFGAIEKGRHRVSVAFVNDASSPAEDRNLSVDRLLVAPFRDEANIVPLTTPPAVALLRRERGTVLIDQLRWDTEEANARKAARYACSLLTALGGDFASRPSWAIECETMTPQPDMGWFHADSTAAHFGCSGWIKTPIEVAAAGRYTMEVVAGGTPAQGVYPHVEISVDGRKAGEVQLTSGGLRPYPVAIELPEGKHELSLAFTNDLNVGGEDRNLTLDKVVFYRE